MDKCSLCVDNNLDYVCHEDLTYKLNKMLPKQQWSNKINIIHFRQTLANKARECLLHLILDKTGVPKGNFLNHILYLLSNNDIPMSEEVKITIFTDDTAVLAVRIYQEVSTRELLIDSNKIHNWTRY